MKKYLFIRDEQNPKTLIIKGLDIFSYDEYPTLDDLIRCFDKLTKEDLQELQGLVDKKNDTATIGGDQCWRLQENTKADFLLINQFPDLCEFVFELLYFSLHSKYKKWVDFSDIEKFAIEELKLRGKEASNFSNKWAMIYDAFFEKKSVFKEVSHLSDKKSDSYFLKNTKFSDEKMIESFQCFRDEFYFPSLYETFKIDTEDDEKKILDVFNLDADACALHQLIAILLDEIEKYLD